MEHSEQERLKRLNAKGEFIHRKSGESQYSIDTPEHYIRSAYSWEQVSKDTEEKKK